MSGPHTGVFGRKDLCNSRIYLLPKDAEIMLLCGLFLAGGIELFRGHVTLQLDFLT